MEKISLPFPAELFEQGVAAQRVREELDRQARKLADVSLRAYRRINGAVAAEEMEDALRRQFEAAAIAGQRALAEQAWRGELGRGALFPGQHGLTRVIPCSPRGEELLEKLSAGNFSLWRQDGEYVLRVEREFFELLPRDGGEAPSWSVQRPRYDFVEVDPVVAGATDEEYREFWAVLRRGAAYLHEILALFPDGFEAPIAFGEVVDFGEPFFGLRLPSGGFAIFGHESGDGDNPWSWLAGVAEGLSWQPHQDDADQLLRQATAEELAFCRELAEGESFGRDQQSLILEALQNPAAQAQEQEEEVNGL